MIVKLLTEHHLEFLSLKGGCRGSPESALVKMSNMEISCQGSNVFQVKHQDGLLQRCKEIIRSNKEKYVQVVEERDTLQRKLEDNQMELAKLQVFEPSPS